MMFDTFNLPNFYLANAAALALYQTGRTSGLVVDCGYQDTKAVPIYEGYTLHHAIM
jgi:actin-related protein